MNRRSILMGILALAVGLTACGLQLRPRGTSYDRSNFKLEIRSNTQWTAVVNDHRSIDGEFNETLGLAGEVPPVCAVVTKSTSSGWIRARVTPGGGWLETRLPDGSLTPCSDG